MVARSFMCRMRRGRGGVSAMLACGSGAFAPLPWLAVSLTSSSSFKQRSKRVCALRVEKWLLPKSCACHVFPVFGSSYFKKLRSRVFHSVEIERSGNIPHKNKRETKTGGKAKQAFVCSPDPTET